MLDAVWRRLTGRTPTSGPPPATPPGWQAYATRDHDPDPVDARLRELTDLLDMEESLVLREGKYFVAGDGTFSDGPFCAGCFDSGHHLVRLRYVDADPGAMGPLGYLSCPDCGAKYPA